MVEERGAALGAASTALRTLLADMYSLCPALANCQRSPGKEALRQDKLSADASTLIAAADQNSVDSVAGICQTPELATQFVTAVMSAALKASESHYHSAPLLQNGAKHRDLRRVLHPSNSSAGCKTRLHTPRL